MPSDGHCHDSANNAFVSLLRITYKCAPLRCSLPNPLPSPTHSLGPVFRSTEIPTRQTTKMDYRRFSSLQNSFQVTVSHGIIAAGDKTSKQAPPAGASNTKKRSPTILPRFIEVVAGPAEELKGWISPETDLKQIPYFKRLLESGELTDNISNIRLPHDDAGAFGQVLHFVRYGKMSYDLPTLCKHNNSSNPDEKIFYSKSDEVVKTIVLARKFGLEELQNTACDALRRSLGHIRLTSADMTYIVDHCERDDPLYRLAMQALAVSIHRRGWSQWRVENNSFYNSLCDGRPYNADLIAEALTAFNDCEPPTTSEGICEWHTHTTAAPCDPPKVEQEVDVTDMKTYDEQPAVTKDEPGDAADMNQFEWVNTCDDETCFDGDECIDDLGSLEDLSKQASLEELSM